ncbi:MAG: HAMP domain-containing histidine kinase [bacterium]|nr:HAMP domain-containing histidine kinase [bacterium]
MRGELQATARRGTTEAALLEKIEELSFLRALNDRLAHVPDFASACRALVELVWAERPVDLVAYASVDHQRRVCRLEAMAPEGGPPASEAFLDAARLTALLEQTEPTALETAPLPGLAGAPGDWLLCAPTRVRDVTSGFLFVRGTGDEDSEAMRRLLAIVATSAALALDAARREAREEFLAMLRHDINNPVAVALGYTEMLGDALVAGGHTELKRLADSVTQALTSVADLVSNTLHLTAIEQATPWLHRSAFDLTALARETVEQLRPWAEAQHIACALEGPSVQVDADRRQLGRVVANLVGNAIKYTPPAGRIRVRVARDGRDSLLCVTDSGHGLTADQLAHVFEKYARFHRHLGIPGTGLGLYLSRAIVEAHGGSIQVESARNRGSTFVVRLPPTRVSAAGR